LAFGFVEVLRISTTRPTRIRATARESMTAIRHRLQTRYAATVSTRRALSM
jgi:hypothetical protein